jgi:hypothetical protein
MSWNHRSKIAAVAIVIQSVAGTFTAPNTTTDLVAVSDLTNTGDMYSANDPTLSGTIWDVNRIYLGRTETIGFTLPLRGPGGATPPAAGAWVPGRALRAAGFTETRNGTAVTGTTQAGSTTTSIVLGAGESSVDDFWLGAPLQTAAIGTVGTVKGTAAIFDYTGSSKTAVIGETVTAPGTGVSYTIPAFLSYVLGTLTTAPPILSISVWRDKTRYDYRDCVVQSFNVNAPVANEQNTSFPSIEFTFKGILVAKYDDTTPTIPQSILSVTPPANRGGKFALDKVKLGHANLRIGATADTGAASNANVDPGQDGYDILSGSRTVELDLNAMNITDFDIEARINNQTIIGVESIWGAGIGNRFLLAVPNMVLDPQNVGDRNGYVSLTGNGNPTDLDKSMALTVFY